MTKLLKYSLLVLAGLLFAAACEKPVSDGSAPITASVRRSNAGPASGDVFVSVKYAGSWTISLTDEDGEPVDWAQLLDKNGKPLDKGRGEVNNIFLLYEKNDTGEDRKLEIHAVPDKGNEYVISFTQFFKDVAAYRDDNFPTGWLELPEKKSGAGLSFYTHPMTIKGSLRSRNYSFCYDRSNLTSWWVAYPLNGTLISSGSRTDAWNYDPKVSQSEQQNLSGGYGSGYDRGHQCPSADRLSSAANRETFYYTNMTPQRSSFNQGMWANFEAKVRDWSRAAGVDTLYVVTGCQVEHPIGYVLDRDRKSVPVPSAYFKALVAYSKSKSLLSVSTPNGSYTGVGFWFDHKNPGSSYMKGKISIDELESKLGYDLFVNLPGIAGEAAAESIESALDSWWQ